MFRRTPFLLVLVIALFLGVGCSGDNSVSPVVSTGPVVQGVIDTSPVSGRSLTVFAGGGEVAPDASGAFQIKTLGEGLGAVGASDAQGRVVFLSLANGAPAGARGAAPVSLSSTETVKSLVLLAPLWNVATVDERDELAALLVVLPEFDAAVAAYEDFIATGGALDLESARDTAFMDSYRILLQAFEAVLHDMAAKSGGWDKAVGAGPYYGVGVTVESRTATDVTFHVTNNRRRWLAIWGTTDTTGVLENLDILPSPSVSLASALVALFRGESLIEVESQLLIVPAVDATSLRVKCYGLGLVGLDQDVEWNRVIEPAVANVALDIGAEIVQLVTTVPMEMRGRPRNHPGWRLVELGLRQAAVRNVDIVHAFRTQQLADGLAIVADCFIASATEDPRATADILIDIAAWMGVEGLTRAAFARVIGPIQLINYATGLGNLAWAAASIIASPPVVAIDVPLDGVPAENDATIGGTVVDAATGEAVVNVEVTSSNAGFMAGGATSGPDGVFELATSAGLRDITFARPGYYVLSRTVNVAAGASNWMGRVELVPVDRGVGSIGGRVVDAQTGGAVGGFALELRRSGADPGSPDVGTTTTDGSGRYGFTSLSPGVYRLTGRLAGYSDIEIDIAAVSGATSQVDDIVVSRTVVEGGYRIVLSWGQSPSDLDSHLLVRDEEGYEYEVRYNQRGSNTSLPFAWLDRDDVTSYGPETITVTQSLGGSYSYAVYQYSSGGSLETSAARVSLFDDQGLVQTWNVPAGSGRWWHVFDIDTATGAVVPANELSSVPPDGMSPNKAGETK